MRATSGMSERVRGCETHWVLSTDGDSRTRTKVVHQWFADGVLASRRKARIRPTHQHALHDQALDTYLLIFFFRQTKYAHALSSRTILSPL